MFFESNTSFNNALEERSFVFKLFDQIDFRTVTVRSFNETFVEFIWL